MAPALGLVASAASFGLHLRSLQNDPNAGKVVALLGDSIGVLGAALETFPPTIPAGLVVSGIGAGVTALGEGLSWMLERGEVTQQQREFLAAAGISGPLVETLVDADQERVQELVTELGMTPAEVQRLATDYPSLLTEGSGNGLVLDRFMDMAKAYGLSGTQVYDLLRGMGAGAENPQGAMLMVLQHLSLNEFAHAQTPADFQQVLESGMEEMREDKRRGVENTLAYLRGISSGG
jgi:hypothetical protein